MGPTCAFATSNPALLTTHTHTHTRTHTEAEPFSSRALRNGAIRTRKHTLAESLAFQRRVALKLLHGHGNRLRCLGAFIDHLERSTASRLVRNLIEIDGGDLGVVVITVMMV